MSKTDPGNFFEDFAIGQVIEHATPRTITAGDQALYTALYGSRFALQSADSVAHACGLPAAPIDDLLVFHVVFGKTVPDISLNAVANLGYADCVFGAPVYYGDTLHARSEIIGLKQNSNGKTGTVYVRTQGANQHGDPVLDYVRWVMVRKATASAPAPEALVPDLPKSVPPERLTVDKALKPQGLDLARTGSPHLWEDYGPGERIDHVDGMTIEEAEHQLATRLYQNSAKVHFNLHSEREGRFGRRIVYGGHIISLARALSFNGLGNAMKVLAINAGRHTAPSFAGDTIYAWSEVLERLALPSRDDVGALRLRTIALKDRSAEDFTLKDTEGAYDPSVVLDLDHTVMIARRAST
jgi:2-methylfumaryl-CoA hydratase